MKPIIFLLIMLFAGLVHAAESQAGFSVIDDDGTGHVYFLKSEPLTQTIFIQWRDKHMRPKCCIPINRADLKKTDAKTATDAQHIDISNAGDDASDPGFVAYKVTPKLPHDSGGSIGMAIAANKITKISPYRLLANTNSKQLTAWVCFGEEGMTLISKEGREFQSWYMYFGYDIDKSVQPKCNAKDRASIAKSAMTIQSKN